MAMRPTIVIGTRDVELYFIVRHCLAQSGFATSLQSDTAGILSVTLSADVCGLLIDGRLRTAATVCERVRQRDAGMSIHIIGIADPRSPAQVRDLIKAGTNEVFSRPVAPIHVVRAFLSKGVQSSLSYGDIEMDIQAQRVWRRTFAIALPRIEFAILHQLLLCPERILNRREIISRSWPSGVFVDPKTVNVHIGNLRRLLMVGGLANPIRSVRGAGYGMELPTELGKNPQADG